MIFKFDKLRVSGTVGAEGAEGAEGASTEEDKEVCPVPGGGR